MRCWPLLLLIALPLHAAGPTAAQLEHFENKVRPVLIEYCGKCHGEPAKGKEPKGGLRTDSLATLLEGGDTGPAIVPGDIAKGKLLEAIRYKNTDLLMPPKGKLDDVVIKDLELWIRDGAVWPKETKAVATASTFDLAKRKKEHWAWQPLAKSDKALSVDQELHRKLKEKGPSPVQRADKLTLMRRATFALTGLPPTPAEITAFENDTSPKAFETLIDRLLNTPQFGERWARHWLDLVRYAESRGHEFEPDIANATEYRDYVIRAFNADVPYDQLLKEHLAGDVLPNPRIDPKSGFNESLVGPGFWHLGEEVHSPVDIRQDQADRLDNRIDVLTKTFLGLTVACARCHDHKFDAISTKDYYSLFGLLEASAYRQARPDGWKQNRDVARQLAELQRKQFDPLKQNVDSTFDAKTTAWLAKADVVIDYAKLKPGEWLPDDMTFGDGPLPAGSVHHRHGEPVVEPRTAAVFNSFWAKLKLKNTQADYGPLGRVPRAGFSIRTPSFVLTKPTLWYLVRGGGMAYAGVSQHTILAGPLHGEVVKVFKTDDQYRWVGHDLAKLRGLRTHVELSADPTTNFAVAMIVQSDSAPPPLVPSPPAPTQKVDLAAYLNAERELQKAVVWESRQVLSCWEGPAASGQVFIRGNPRTPGATVPARTLEAHGAKELKHGRLELAQRWCDPVQTPAVPRVAVNRVWHQLFGVGLVPSVDNFGLLGEVPTHPELLDRLATDFVADGWSVKRLIRKLMLTEAYQRSSTPSPEALKLDPTNSLLHSFRVKRLEGEAIRDAMLAVSGRLDATVYGPSVPIALTPFLDGRGKPGVSGPIDGAGRRSIYLSVRRNFLNPFLLSFDTPIPFSTVGRRQVSNVPAQALTMLNDPFVQGQAEVTAKRLLATPGSTTERVDRLYRLSLGRGATQKELDTCVEFLKSGEPQQWADLVHTVWNVKEFLYVR